MKNIKDIVIGIFAVIGFAAIVTGFTNEAEQEHTVSESHVWVLNNKGYLLNKQTGEVKYHWGVSRDQYWVSPKKWEKKKK